jgi:hypothetical protein
MASKSVDRGLEKVIEIVKKRLRSSDTLDENLNKFASDFRRLYYSPNRMTFKQGCEAVGSILDDLN